MVTAPTLKQSKLATHLRSALPLCHCAESMSYDSNAGCGCSGKRVEDR